MSKKAFDRIAEGLNEALAVVRGSKQLDTEYFLLLDLECQFIQAGNDVIAARAMARNELLRRRNSDAKYDSDYEDRGR